jgi:hypothetical protein
VPEYTLNDWYPGCRSVTRYTPSAALQTCSRPKVAPAHAWVTGAPVAASTTVSSTVPGGRKLSSTVIEAPSPSSKIVAPSRFSLLYA